VGGNDQSAIEHGGNLHDAKARFPEAPEPWIDLSTGINPTPYPFEPPPLSAYARLPSPGDILELERVAAQAYGAPDPAGVIAAAGSQPIIQLLPRLRPIGRVTVLGPTYGEHQRCWLAAGHRVEVVAGLDEAVRTRPDVMVVVNPNNPDGRVIATETFRSIAKDLASLGAWLVVDEAFADLEDGVSLVPDLPANAIVLRSLGKAYGLAGLRVGFAVTKPRLAEAIRTGIGPWAVSGPAIAIGAAALSDAAWLAGQARLLKESSAKLDRHLVNAGFTIVGGTRLFRLAFHPQAQQRFKQFAQKGLWCRQFPENPDLLRFGNPTADAWERVVAALRSG
jgi:cobalamin biosynthetic protein CobC